MSSCCRGVFDGEMKAVVEGIDWSAVDDLSCGIEVEVSGDARHQPAHTDSSHGKPALLLFYPRTLPVRFCHFNHRTVTSAA